MEDMYNNYRMVEEVKERAVNRGSGVTEFESYDRVAKIEFNDWREKRSCGFWRLPPEW